MAFHASLIHKLQAPLRVFGLRGHLNFLQGETRHCFFQLRTWSPRDFSYDDPVVKKAGKGDSDSDARLENIFRVGD